MIGDKNIKNVYLLSHDRYLQKSLIIITFGISFIFAILGITTGLIFEEKLKLDIEIILPMSFIFVVVIYVTVIFYLPTRKKRFEIVKKLQALEF